MNAKVSAGLMGLVDKVQEYPELLDRLLLVADNSAPKRPLMEAKDAYPHVAPLLLGQAYERVVVLALDRRHQPISVEALTIGNDGFTVVCPRQIFRWALMQGPSGAHSIVLAHNHPSGDQTPSIQDKEVTRRVAAAGRMIGIQLLDHLVVSDRGYVSLAERGELPAWIENSIGTN